MEQSFFGQLFHQFRQMWQSFQTYQKATILGACLTFILMFAFLILSAVASNNYLPLYPSDRLSGSDAAEIQSYLSSTSIPYELQGETAIFVPAESVHKIRMDLASMGLPKIQSYEGFELFDSNTWIRGEKELQILEVRALKGQLEQDITQYDNIRNANVILDIAQPRAFGSSSYKTKASVILNLMPGARLNSSQLRSITFHLAGAVRGLAPNMVAISDTSGKLYQSIDPQGSFENIHHSEVALEDHLKAKIDGMLAMVVGLDNYYSTVQVVMSRDRMTEEYKVFPKASAVTNPKTGLLKKNESPIEHLAKAVIPQIAGEDSARINNIKVVSEPGKIESISVSVLIDKSIAVTQTADLPKSELQEGLRYTENLQGEITRQINAILQGYNTIIHEAVDFVEFDKSRFSLYPTDETWNPAQEHLPKQIWLIAMIVIGSTLLIGLTISLLFQFLGSKRAKTEPLSPPAHHHPSSKTAIAQIQQEIRNHPKRATRALRKWVTMLKEA